MTSAIELGIYPYSDEPEGDAFRFPYQTHFAVSVRQPITGGDMRIELLFLQEDRQSVHVYSLSQPAAQFITSSIENAFFIIAKREAEASEAATRLRKMGKLN